MWSLILLVPWLLFSVIGYWLTVAFSSTNPSETSKLCYGERNPTDGACEATQILDAQLFDMNMISGAQWSFTVSDLLITLSLVFLFVEILKSTRTGGNSLIDHGFSTVVFVLSLILFLVVPKFATSTFFIIMLISLIDVIAGFSVTIRAARRDMNLGGALPT